MTSAFSGHILAPYETRAVYPLVREAMPTLHMKAWMAFARRAANPRRADRMGIMVVQRRSRALPCGLFIYRVDQDLTHGKVLVAEHFVAVDVLDPEAVMHALTGELDRLAKRLGCAAIRATVLRHDSIVESSLHAAGHRSDGATLWKFLRDVEPLEESEASEAR